MTNLQDNPTIMTDTAQLRDRWEEAQHYHREQDAKEFNQLFLTLFKVNLTAVKLKKNVSLYSLYQLLFKEYDGHLYKHIAEQLKTIGSPIRDCVEDNGFSVATSMYQGKEKVFINLNPDVEKDVYICKDPDRDVIDKVIEYLPKMGLESISYTGLKDSIDLTNDQSNALHRMLMADKSELHDAVKKIGFYCSRRARKNGVVSLWITRKGEVAGTDWTREYGARQRHSDYNNTLRKEKVKATEALNAQLEERARWLIANDPQLNEIRDQIKQVQDTIQQRVEQKFHKKHPGLELPDEYVFLPEFKFYEE